MSDAQRDPTEIAFDKPKLFSSTMVMAAGTGVSRVLGFVRNILIVYIFVAGSRQADIFNTGSTLATTVNMLLAGGVLNAILVPQLMRAMRRDPDGGQAYSDRIVTLFGILLLAATLVLAVGTRVVMLVMAPSDWRVPELAAQYESLLFLTAVCMPQLIFLGLYALAGQILNARGSYGPVMWAPVFNNVIQIAMLGAYAVIWGMRTNPSEAFTTRQVLLLGIGSILSSVVQAAILIPYLKKVGFRYRPRFDFLHTGLGATAHMAKWVIAFVAIDQILTIVGTRLLLRATAGGDGAGQQVYQSAMLIGQVPHALLTVSLVSILLPSLSKLAAAHEWDRFASQFGSSVRTIYVAIIPVSVLFVAIGLPIGQVVFRTSYGGTYIGWTLVVFALGLVPMSLRLLVQKAFNSMENTRTPFMTEILFVAVVCAISIPMVLAGPAVLKDGAPAWVAPSLALGYALAYIAATALSWRLLRRAIPSPIEPIAGFTIRLAAISVPGAALAALVCWLQARFVPGIIPGWIGLVTAGIVGIGVYWGLARVARVSEVLELEDLVRARLRKENPVQTTGAGTPPIPDMFSSEETQPILTGLTPLVPGALVCDRYRLGELMGRVGKATRWSGVDDGLSRPVLITAFANNEQAMPILEAARVASGAMDARFLRILDAGKDADVAYVISERAEGATLAQILQYGALTNDESAWVAREIASGLASIHALHVYHCRLDPTEVFISTSGEVKVAGLRTDQALTPRDTDANATRTDMEAMDVVACGALMYACLTATWPGGTYTGLSQSPRGPEGLAPPAHVRESVSAELDRLSHRIMSKGDPERITTAREIDNELTALLDRRDLSESLAARVAAVRPAVPQATLVPTPGRPAPAQRPTIVPAREGTEDPTVAIPVAPVGHGGHGEGALQGGGSDVPPGQTQEIPPIEETSLQPVAVPGQTEPSMPSEPSQAKTLTKTVPPQNAWAWSIGFWVLVIIVAVALLSAVVVGLYNWSRPQAETTGPAGGLTTRTITTAVVFDSAEDGGDGSENDDQVNNAFDGDPATVWTTEQYPPDYIPNKKPGVGLLFKLSGADQISQVTLTTILTPTKVKVCVPRGDPATVTTPDMKTIDNWTSLVEKDLTAGTTTIDIPPTSTQYVLIYITSLGDAGEYKQADIAEVTFAG